jgi:hypothetical protein
VTARILVPHEATDVIDGEKRADRDGRCIVDGFAGPDHLLLGVLDVLEADGVCVKATARLRGYLRRVQKRMGGGRS